VDHQVVAPPLRGRDDHAVVFAQPEKGIQGVHDFGAVTDDQQHLGLAGILGFTPLETGL
jgi:hypothetical protein